MKKVFNFTVIFAFFYVFSNSYAIDLNSKEFLQYKELACEILEKSYDTCLEASHQLNIFKDSNGCNELSVDISVETVKEYKKTDKVFLELVKRSAYVCFSACMGDTEVKRNLDEECR